MSTWIPDTPLRCAWRDTFLLWRWVTVFLAPIARAFSRRFLRRTGAWVSFCLAFTAVTLLTSFAAHAAITKVQAVTFPAQGAGTSTTVSFASTPVVGNTIVVFVWSWGGNAVAGNAISVTDNQGNTYSSLPQVSTSLSGAPGYQDAAILSTTAIT